MKNTFLFAAIFITIVGFIFTFSCSKCNLSLNNYIPTKQEVKNFSFGEFFCHFLNFCSEKELKITNVQILNLSYSSASINWETNVKANSQVEYGVSNNFGFKTKLTTDSVNMHSVFLTGLMPSTLYYFRVKSGEIISKEYTFTTLSSTLPKDTTPPSTPTELYLIEKTGNSVKFGWSPSVDQETSSDIVYEIYKDNSYVSETSDLSMEILNLLSMNTYSFTLKSKDVSGNVSQMSEPLVVTTLDNISPTVSITNLTQGETITGTKTINVTATDNISVAKVEFYQNNILVRTDTLSPYSYSFNSKSVSDGSITFYVKAYDTLDNVSSSDSVTVVVSNEEVLPPLVISNVLATDITENSVKITWNTNNSSNSEVIYGKTTSYGSTSGINSTLVTSHSIAIDNLSPNSLYYFKVKSGTNTSVQYQFTTLLSEQTAVNLKYGMNIGTPGIIFSISGSQVSINPEAQKALSQLKKDGITHIALMQVFAKKYLTNQYPKPQVDMVKLLKNQGFEVHLSLDGAPFKDESSNTENSWFYRYFPGDEIVGSDDDGGIVEYKIRLTKLMDSLKSAGVLNGMYIQFADEPNSKSSFFGTYSQYLELLSAKINVVTNPVYSIPKDHIICCGFTSKLMTYGASMVGQEQYWDFIKNYKNNVLVKDFSFSFNWYPSSGISPTALDFTPADIKLSPMYKGAWIGGMNVDASLTWNKLFGNGVYPGYRETNKFKEKLQEIILYAKNNSFSGIYFFNLLSKTDTVGVDGNVGFGFFKKDGVNAGCPRYEYKVLLEVLNKPINFGSCPIPSASEF